MQDYYESCNFLRLRQEPSLSIFVRLILKEDVCEKKVIYILYKYTYKQKKF